MKKSKSEFLHRLIGDLSSGQNKAINALQLCLKPLKSNLQTLFFIGGRIFYYFRVTLYNVFRQYMYGITKCIKI